MSAIRILPILFALLAAAAVITAGGETVGLGNAWAFHFLTYVPVLLRWIMGVAIVAASLPFEWPMPRVPRLRIPWWTAVPVGMVLFWLLRERTRHGDAEFKVWLLGHESLRTDPFVWKEPLDALVAYTLSGLLAPFGWTPDTAIALASTVAGGIFLVAVLWGVRRLARGHTQAQWAMTIAMLALGSSQLWFGHVENYSWVTAFTVLTVMLAAAHLVGAGGGTPGSLWPIGLAGGVAVSFHPQAAFAMPALLVLPRPGRRLRDALVLAGSGVAPILGTVILFRALGVPWPETKDGFARDPQLFWTPAQAFAPAQLAGAFNNLWLLVPAWPLWVLAGATVWIDAERRRDPVSRYLAAVALGLLVYHFTFQNDLDRAKDWDLYAVVGPPLALWGVHAWLGAMDRVSTATLSLLGRLLTVGLVFATLFTAAWVGVNAHYRVLQ